MIEHLIPILVGTLAAGAPLIFAGLGELGAARTGVIKLGGDFFGNAQSRQRLFQLAAHVA